MGVPFVPRNLRHYLRIIAAGPGDRSFHACRTSTTMELTKAALVLPIPKNRTPIRITVSYSWVPNFHGLLVWGAGVAKNLV